MGEAQIYAGVEARQVNDVESTLLTKTI